ncbi:hypothetical protein [Methylophilus sp. Leaf408]|uniref:hypothetical protein n=1 Tax=Methylophilus sp. Leaf408 TaxID=2876561 RepID=UPI001E58F77B|nr:hypothetical protein [Methylophilus sp. Leaf408]
MNSKSLLLSLVLCQSIMILLLSGCGFDESFDACLLDKPPKSAKVHSTHAIDFYVYPDAVPKSFTGCQKVWLEDGGLLTFLRYKNGLISDVELNEPDQKKIICKFSHSDLFEGPSDKCLPYKKWTIFNTQ